MQKAWGNITITHVSTALDNREQFAFHKSVTPDGSWLLGAVQPRTLLTNTTLISYAAMYNIHTHQIVRLHPLQTPQSQIMHISADDHWIAWSEADDQPGFLDWTMYVYNRQTGDVRELAHAIHQDGKPVAGPYSGPVVDHDHVLWSESLNPVTTQDLSQVVVKEEDLTSGNQVTLAIGAGDVLLSWPWAGWADQGASSGFERLTNLVTQQTIKVPVEASYIAISGTSLVYTTDPSSLVVIDDFTKSPQTPTTIPFTAFSQADIEFDTLNSRLIGFRQMGGVFVFDRQEHHFVQITQAEPWRQSNETQIVGPYLIWYENESQVQATQDDRNGLLHNYTIDIVDTRHLPVLSVKD